jgi:methylaspartate mutase epsilon subunit
MRAFSQIMQEAKSQGELIVQPRMGFGTIEAMLQGLHAVKIAHARTIGTITLDSYTRVNQYEKARLALKNGEILNGYPIVSHGVESTKAMISELECENFSIQVRHGTALPYEVFETILASGIDATEGGPISYCLPYSRVPLEAAIKNWRESCQLFAKANTAHRNNHIESFAGCMLGQLCPPSLLIALGILEGLFFKTYGICSVSLSYAQGTHKQQDIAALKVLRNLAGEYLSDVDWHVVMYTYMGVFPATVCGAYQLISDSAKIAAYSHCERLIVKTPAEAHRIPTVTENIASLEMAYSASKDLSLFEADFDHGEYQII